MANPNVSEKSEKEKRDEEDKIKFLRELGLCPVLGWIPDNYDHVMYELLCGKFECFITIIIFILCYFILFIIILRRSSQVYKVY